MERTHTPKARPDRVSPDTRRPPETHAVPTTMSDHIMAFLVECGDRPRLWPWQDVVNGNAPMTMDAAAKELERFDAEGLYASAPDVMECHLTLDELAGLAKDMSVTDWYVHRKIYESGISFDQATAAELYDMMTDPDHEMPREQIESVLEIRDALKRRAEAGLRG